MCSDDPFFIPFNVKKEVCSDLFYAWAKTLWFAPFDFQSSLILNEFKAVFIPYWEFEVETFTKYNGSNCNSKQFWISGSRWEVGVYFNKFSHIMVCAAGSREASLIQYIEPWKENQREPFNQNHMEDAEIQPSTLEPDRAWASVGKPSVQLSIEDGIRKQVQRKMTGLTMDTSFSNQKVRRVFVPVFSTTYEYRGKSYSFLINANTAKTYGDRPFSSS